MIRPELCSPCVGELGVEASREKLIRQLLGIYKFKELTQRFIKDQ